MVSPARPRANTRRRGPRLLARSIRHLWHGRPQGRPLVSIHSPSLSSCGSRRLGTEGRLAPSRPSCVQPRPEEIAARMKMEIACHTLERRERQLSTHSRSKADRLLSAQPSRRAAGRQGGHLRRSDALVACSIAGIGKVTRIQAVYRAVAPYAHRAIRAQNSGKYRLQSQRSRRLRHEWPCLRNDRRYR